MHHFVAVVAGLEFTPFSLLPLFPFSLPLLVLLAVAAVPWHKLDFHTALFQHREGDADRKTVCERQREGREGGMAEKY